MMIGVGDLFRSWLRTASKGARLTYYTGFIGADRGSEDAFERTSAQQAVHELADLVNAARERGAVTLTQKRIGESVYAYYATRR